MIEPNDAAVIRSWLKTGLIAGWIAVIGTAMSVIGRLSVQRMGIWVAVVGLIAVVSVFVAYGFLRRVLLDPSLQNRPQVPRLRRLSSIAAYAYGAALLANVFRATRAGEADVPIPLTIASLVLAGVAVLSFAAVLVGAGKLKSSI